MRRAASWELVAEGGVHDQVANGEAFEPNNWTIIDVCISAMLKCTKNVEKLQIFFDWSKSWKNGSKSQIESYEKIIHIE